ncbi:MAG: lipopolysaccharide biosynthesis protein [Rhodobacteraceae bacterium]|nr:lipopolysaccharide biosynthesis protein [Paracoccaceae bacterium]
MKLDLKYYLTVFMRRSPIMLVITALFTSIGLSVAMVLPPEYEAKALLLVESEQIPANLAASTVQTQAAEQLQIIEQRMMTRTNLLDMANRLELFQNAGKDGEPLTANEIVSSMRSRTTFASTGTAPKRRGSNSATIVSISYRGNTPAEVAKVANEFVTLVLQENVEIRTEQAGATLEFFEQEVERLGTELDTHSAQLLEFQAEAGAALPANVPFLQQQLTSFQTTLDIRLKDIATLKDQSRRLVELFEQTGGVQSANTQLSPLEQRLDAARQALEDAKLVYSEQNPKLAVMKARVVQLEKAVADQLMASSGTSGSDEDPQISREEQLLNAQLADIDNQIALLETEVETLNAKIAQIEADMAEAPTNGVGLSKLQRDFNNINGQYNQAVARLSAAATGERIELLAKGQRISVIEQAVPPGSPNKPNRMAIAVGSVGAGILSGLGLIVLLELMNRSIRRPVELTNKLGITPMAVLPYLKTDHEIYMRRLFTFGTVAFFIIAVPLGIYAVHTLIFPLETVLEPILNKVGYSII